MDHTHSMDSLCRPPVALLCRCSPEEFGWLLTCGPAAAVGGEERESSERGGEKERRGESREGKGGGEGEERGGEEGSRGI